MADPRVLVLATTTGYQIRSFGEAARALGVRLAFASDRCDQLDDPWWDRAIPVRFHDVSGSVVRVVSGATDFAIRGLIAVGDRPTVLAAAVAECLGLPGNPVAAAMASRNKLATREAFARAGLLTPVFVRLDHGTAAAAAVAAERVGFPLVLKPLALSGSRGVMRVDTATALDESVDRLRRLLDAPDIRIERDPAHAAMLVESFIPGREYAVEGLLTDGTLRVLAIFDKPDPLDGPFFEETIYVTPSRASSQVQQAIASTLEQGVRALGLRHGPVHAECRVNDRGVWLLEIAARPIGGLCSRALRFGDITLEALLLRHALGEDVTRLAQQSGDASAVMMIPIPRRGIYRGVTGVHDAARVPGVTGIEITAKQDSLLVPLPEGRSYLGFIFARGGAPGDAEHAVREAHARLRFIIEREVPVTVP
jgi:biotin carboxylase